MKHTNNVRLIVTKQQTITYHVSFGDKKRRFFTKNAAYKWLARNMILASDKWSCTCEPPEQGGDSFIYPGYTTCPYHSGEANALCLRLVRWLKFCDRKTASSVDDVIREMGQ